MYTPKNSTTLDKCTEPQIRLLIQGFPGTGKTHAALTFPGSIVGNHDRGLGSHYGRTDVIEIPFYAPTFYKPSNRRDFYRKFLETEGIQLTADQTYIDDSWTAIQDAFDEQTIKEPVYGSNGKEDTFAFWRRKLDYSREVCDFYKRMQCNVVVTCHETVERNDDGRVVGVRPLQQGAFSDKLGSYFTDVFRQVVIPKPTTPEKLNAVKFEQFGCKHVSDFQKLMAEFPTTDTMFFWQTRPCELAKCKNCLVGAPLYIPAMFKYYAKYRRTISQ